MEREMKFTYTGILHDKNGEKLVRVSFEREKQGKREFAEGAVPACKIDSSFGFSDEELGRLEAYLKENSAEIMLRAREITGITHWLR